MAIEQRIDLAANGIEADRLAKHIVSTPPQVRAGDRVVGGVCHDQDPAAVQPQRDLGQGRFAVVMQEADAEQDDIRRPVRGFGKCLVEVGK